MISFSQFSRNVSAIAHPEGVAENLVSMFRTAVCNALIETQTFIPCYRDYHADFHCASDWTDFCSAIILNGPRGVIQQLYTFKPGQDCRKYFYQRKSTQFLQCWVDQQRCATCGPTDPVTVDLYSQPYCTYPIPGAAGATDPYTPGGVEDDACYKYQPKYFAVGPDYRLYAAPRPPAGYLLGVSWSGVKRCWNNADGVLEDEDLKKAVAHYAEAEMGLKDRDLPAYQSCKSAWLQTLKQMAHRCRQERRTPLARDCSSALVDTLLPWVSPLNLSQPTNATTCARPVDLSAPYITCNEVGTSTVVGSSCVTQIYTYVTDPNAEGILPANPNCPSICYQENGSGSSLNWSISQQLWV